MPPFVLQQDCDNPCHLVTRLGGAYETEMTTDSHLVVFYDRATPLNVIKRVFAKNSNRTVTSRGRGWSFAMNKFDSSSLIVMETESATSQFACGAPRLSALLQF